MQSISYLPTSLYSKNQGYDRRNIILYSKLKHIKLHKFNDKKQYDYLILPPTFDISDLEWLKKRKEKIIYQLVDDYLSEKNYSLKNYFRGFYKFLKRDHKYIIFNYKKKIKEICKISKIVICSSENQKKEISKINKNVKIMFEGNFKDIDVIKKNFKKKSIFKIVWEGRCENIAGLKVFYPAFKRLLKKKNIELHIITDFEINKHFLLNKYKTINELKKIFEDNFSTNTTFKKSNVFLHQWNISFSKILIANSDLAIIPQRKDFNFDQGRGGNKLLMFMRMRIPVLTSNINSYKNIFKNIKINATCNSTNDWVTKINKLLNSETLRKRYATIGHNYVNKFYNTKQFIAQWDNLFKL